MSDAELQAEIESFGRMHVTSTHVSRAVVRSQSREALLAEVVRVLVDAGRFSMAFVAWHDPAAGELVPAARFGKGQEYADRIRLFTDARPEGQGPAGTAFREGVPAVCNDFLNDPNTLPWREAARVFGWRSSAAFPILIGGVPRGVLSVYAVSPGFFGPEQVELLREVTLDVAFGIERLDSEERRRQAEAALAASENRLKLAMDAATLGTFDWDLQTGNIAWDGQHERIFGFTPGGAGSEVADGTYDCFEKCVHPADLPGLRRAVDAATQSREALAHEFRVAWPDGSEHWVLARGRFHYTDSGRPSRMYGAVSNITARKQGEAALLESEERLRQAVRVANIGIFDHDHITGAIYWSPQQRLIHGWGADEPVALWAGGDVVHPGERQKIYEAIRHSHDPSGDGLFDAEYTLMLRDGSTRRTRTRSQTFFAGEGAARHPVRTVGAVMDITPQKRTEDELKKLAAVVAMSRDFIGIATLEGRVVYLNQAAMTLVGLQSIEEACQKTVFDFFPADERAQVENGMYAGVRSFGYWSGETHLRHFVTGQPIDVEINAFQIYDNSGAPLYIATVTRDMTERNRAAAEKTKLEEQLFQARKMESIGRLAGGVAHDFNNLLTVINGYSDLLLSDLRTSSLPGVAEINRAGERAAALTRQLLAFSRKQVLQPRVLDLNRVVAEMRPMLERLVGEDVELRVALDAESGAVHADPHQLEQAVMNLVVNARDAMPDGGKLWIATAGVDLDRNYIRSHPEARAGRYVMLAVSDSGAGMDEETRLRVFEPFFTTKRAGHGTGLGLSTVQGIVAQSGGHVNVYSEPGHGTTFRIYLPALTDAEADSGKPVPPVAVQGGRETILVVEDQEPVRVFAVAVLREYGYRVIQAENAAEALRLCERESGRIHLVLTDVVMPDLSGRGLVEKLAALRPGIKVLFMSGYTDKVVIYHGVLEEGVEFIEKPFSPEELAGKIRAILGPPAPDA